MVLLGFVSDMMLLWVSAIISLALMTLSIGLRGPSWKDFSWEDVFLEDISWVDVFWKDVCQEDVSQKDIISNVKINASGSFAPCSGALVVAKMAYLGYFMGHPLINDSS